MANVTNPNVDRPSEARFEFALILIICIAVSFTLAVVLAGVGYMVWQ
ncbi:MAG TPA: hypothetical protein VFQ00_03635 [Terriglobales bacterium]|nr:hypothetical protein [Terriglobales bacterium]